MRFSMKKLLDENVGQTIELDTNWSVKLNAQLEAHDYGDTEPYMEAAAIIRIFKGKKCVSKILASEGVIFPKSLPNEIREPLMKLVNKVMDFVVSYDLSNIYWRMKDKGQWPPDPKTWIDRKADVPC